jgi:hypothetical protein
MAPSGKNYPLYKGALPRQTRELLRQKILVIPQVSTAETDETGFGGFVTMPLGIFAQPLGANLKGRPGLSERGANIDMNQLAMAAQANID